MTVVAGSADAGKRLDAFLHERLPEFSRARLQSWIKTGRVLIGADRPRASYTLRGGEVIAVSPSDLPPLRAEAEEIPVTVLYEDDSVIAVDKPAGMVVHAGAGHHTGTLVNALLHRFGSLSGVNGDLRPGIVHRLDKETSGVLLVAKTDAAHRALAEQFQNRIVQKMYLAVVHGKLKQKTGRITAPIARDPIHRTRMTARLASGRVALTEYRLLEEFERFSYVEVKIGTGRTHQIRVHMASLHHAIVGDSLYGAPAAPPGLPPLQRFYLHAAKIAFRSPAAGAWVEVETPLPPDFQMLLAHLRTARIR